MTCGDREMGEIKEWKLIVVCAETSGADLQQGRRRWSGESECF